MANRVRFGKTTLIYENVPYEQPIPEPDILAQLTKKQAEQRVQEITEKTLHGTLAELEEDIFIKLRRQQD